MKRRRGKGGTLGVGEVNDVSVLLEHVDFLNGLDGLDVHLLECGLEFLVVRGGGLVDALGLAAGGTFSSVQISSVQAGRSVVGEYSMIIPVDDRHTLLHHTG